MADDLPTSGLMPLGTSVPAELGELLERAAELARESIGPATRRAYASTWSTWSKWCAESEGAAQVARGLGLPGADPRAGRPELVAAWLTELEGLGRKVSTLRRHLYALAVLHRAAGLPDPSKSEFVQRVVKGAAKRHGVAQDQAPPVLLEELVAMVEVCPDSRAGRRDRALVLLGWHMGARRAELAALELGDLVEKHGHLVVQIRRSKTDQEGEGRVAIIFPSSRPKLDALEAVRVWLAELDAEEGPLFRPVYHSDRIARNRGLAPRAVGEIIKRTALRAGLDDVRGHSLRAGFITQSYIRGIPEHVIQSQTGQTSANTVRRYKRGSEYATRAPLRRLT